MHRTRRLPCFIAVIVFAGCIAGEHSSNRANSPPTTSDPQPFVLAARSDTAADPIFQLPPVTTARLETLITPAKLPTSENGAFIEDGRFFVIGAEGVYEIVGGPETFSAVLYAANPGCVFGGITAKGGRLYAPCTRVDTLTADLIVFDPAREEPLVGRAPIATRGFGHFNGTAFGPDGAMYLSNSLAVDVADPAVVRLEFVSEEPLVFEQTAVVTATRTLTAPEDGGGSFPNGIRFHGDTMYYVRGPDLVTVPIGMDEPVSRLDMIYEGEAGAFPFIDDFDIGDERMWLTEFSSSSVFGLSAENQLVVTDLEGNREYAMDLPFIPSSTIVAIDTKFGPASILVTSYFNGGLYRVTFE